MSEKSLATSESKDVRYMVYLIIIALLGWSLASYDSNLLTLTMPAIADDLHLSATVLGILGFLVSGAEVVVCLFVGWGMDHLGRKRMWMICLGIAGIFTGLTFFVQDFWQLAIVRMIASAFAFAELAVSVTLVNEQVPAKRRGFLYSIVQGGWPVGVFLASLLYLLVGQFGWRVVYLFGIIPLVLVAVGRIWVRESDRFTHMKAMHEAVKRDDTAEIARLQAERPVKAEEMKQGSIREIFGTAGRVRSVLIKLTITWLLYSMSFVATNVYIAFWLTKVKGWSADGVATLLLVSGGIGFFFYIIGGILGEKFGRRNVMIVSALLVGPLNLVLLLLTNNVWLAIVFFLIYQVTNGTWSGAGYSYQAEVFPTRVRGTAVGWMGAMNVGGQMLGSAVWILMTSTTNLVITWIVIAVGIGVCQGISTCFLPHIKPGQELEEVAT
ncbi:MFS transporter [Spelaeicoccus albus]|uniref:MFS family permease n=1 Tax=Spelaeicoccus albus TaxID=1280376 RepID=A0A7Z0ABT5_9MICO|nr:MFS transporter [Spelaeicoccus albus]NYI66965.1 MFS family permease [Spelaeicoccus albus]